MSNPFSHIELSTTDLGGMKKFYTKLFKWKLNDSGGPEYAMFTTGAKGASGGMQVKPMPEAPNQWLPYVTVGNVKASLSKAKQLGARVVVPYTTIGDMGAIGVFVDPTGAALGVWEVAKKKATKRRAKK